MPLILLAPFFLLPSYFLLGPILFVADFFHPANRLAVQRFLNGI